MTDVIKTSERFPIGSFWRNKRSGVVAKVEAIERDCLKLSRPGMRTTLKWIDHFVNEYVEADKPVPLTRAKLGDLVSSFAGAINHAQYAGEKLSSAEYEVALNAVEEARIAIIRAVFP